VAAAFSRKIAIRSPREAISYDDLKACADRIARLVVEHARNRAEAPPYPVLMLLPQGVHAIAAQLGILKAGACYVPADTRQTGAQLSAVAKHAGASLIITDRVNLQLARAAAGADVDIVDVVDAVRTAERDGQLPVVRAQALAYIYYTSGSTGAPKGVADTHRNVIHNVLRYTRSLAIRSDDRLTLLQAPCFSGAVSSTYCALLNGATVFPYDLNIDGPDRLAGWLADNAVTIYHSVPAIFRSCVAGRGSYPALRYIRLEGDRALAQDARLFQAHFAPGCRLVNGLGTTETGLVRQFFVAHDTAIDDGPLPIGFPVKGVECSICDDVGNPVEIGRVGEIVAQSMYLAEGYWRDAETTAKKFAAGDGDARRRRYRTGDMGRLRADGCLEYHGRCGTQRKIYGVSVDLADVEMAVLRVPGVLDAVVATAENMAGDLRLVAVVATDVTAALTPARLRTALKAMLPDNAVPTAFHLRDRLPSTPFGKIDRAAIAQIVNGPPAATTAAQEPGGKLGATERNIARIWKAVLGESVVRPDVSFLEYGGDSLLAMQILVRLQSDLGVRMSPEEFFASPTVTSQARFAEAALRVACAADDVSTGVHGT
jgi:amino acid adenylation domain-containing protein